MQNNIQPTPKQSSGNLLLISTISLTLLAPLALIIVSYLNIIDALFLGHLITAIAVVISSIFIIIGGLWMYSQDKADGIAIMQRNKE